MKHTALSEIIFFGILNIYSVILKIINLVKDQSLVLVVLINKWISKIMILCFLEQTY